MTGLLRIDRIRLRTTLSALFALAAGCGGGDRHPPDLADASMSDAPVDRDGSVPLDGSPGADAPREPDAAPPGSPGFTFRTELHASDGVALDIFGAAVATDGTTIAVGADKHDAKGGDTGAVYLFTRISGIWQESDKLTARDASTEDWFGWSLALDRDILVVGAPGHDGAGEEAGAIYIFEQEAGDWRERARLTGSDVEAGDWFGGAVAISGSTVVAGARNHDAGHEDTGGVYVFERVNGVWQETGILSADDGMSGDMLGHSVATHGDMVAAGAPNHEDRTGAVYVFERRGSDWVQQAKLVPMENQANDEWGTSVSMFDEMLVAGAASAAGAAPVSGKAQIFEYREGTWYEGPPLMASVGASGEKFAISGAASAHRIALGAAWDGEKGPFSGAVYVFQLRAGTGNWHESKLLPVDVAEDDWFGLAVAMRDNVLVAGSPYHDHWGLDSGGAYVFERVPEP